jgi:hypothetical protein
MTFNVIARNHAALRRSAKALHGTTCWGIAAGQNTGSVIDLHFGEKLDRPKPIRNPFLPPDLQRYHG